MDDDLGECEIPVLAQGYLGEFCKVVYRSAELPTIIAFSSVNTSAGKFKPYKALAEVAANLIFVNDDGNNWYLKGVKGVGEGYAEAAKELVRLGRQIGNGVVAMFGTSMGAYGALLYSAYGRADLCLAFGPELLHGLPYSRSAQYKACNDTVYASEVITELSKCNCECYIFASEVDEIDLINALPFAQSPDVRLYSLRGVEHPGVQQFDRSIGLPSFIKSMLSDCGALDSCKAIGRCFERPDLIRDLWFAFQLRREKNLVGYLDYLSVYAEKYSDSSLFMLRLGEACYRNGFIDRAVKCFAESIRLDALQFESYNFMGVLFRKKKMYSEAEEFIAKCLEISPRNAFAYHNLGLIYIETGKLDLAEKSFASACAINPGNIEFRNSLIAAQARIAR